MAHLIKLIFVFVLALALPGAMLHAEEEKKSPWTLHDALGLPDWLKFSVEHRTRFEGASNSFRLGTRGGDQVFAFRTLVFAEASYEAFRIGGEFIDSRIDGPTSNTPVNNTQEDDADLLQAYLSWQSKDLFGSGLGAELKFGRQTIDLGSRRLLARNAMRNTINSFTGFNILLKQGEEWQWRNFVVLPVNRLPSDGPLIRNGFTEFDEENFDTIFAGSFLGVEKLPWNSLGEVYFLQLNENDGPRIQTANRNLSTPGLRWYRKAKKNEFDFELESALQSGTSRTNTATSNQRQLSHFSYFGHVGFGYTFGVAWSPRLSLQYDYASGDADPNDGKNGRFDTLFGARRFEFGPTGIWGAFARANINTPGVRLQLNPMENLKGMIAHRAYWLAEKRDTWVGSDLRDPSGRSGSFIGQQLEAQLIWTPIEKLLSFEGGWAHLFKGDFAKNAPGAPRDKDDADYFYVQTTITL